MMTMTTTPGTNKVNMSCYTIYHNRCVLSVGQSETINGVRTLIRHTPTFAMIKKRHSRYKRQPMRPFTVVLTRQPNTVGRFHGFLIYAPSFLLNNLRLLVMKKCQQKRLLRLNLHHHVRNIRLLFLSIQNKLRLKCLILFDHRLLALNFRYHLLLFGLRRDDFRDVGHHLIVNNSTFHHLNFRRVFHVNTNARGPLRYKNISTFNGNTRPLTRLLINHPSTNLLFNRVNLHLFGLLVSNDGLSIRHKRLAIR